MEGPRGPVVASVCRQTRRPREGLESPAHTERPETPGCSPSSPCPHKQEKSLGEKRPDGRSRLRLRQTEFLFELKRDNSPSLRFPLKDVRKHEAGGVVLGNSTSSPHACAHSGHERDRLDGSCPALRVDTVPGEMPLRASSGAFHQLEGLTPFQPTAELSPGRPCVGHQVHHLQDGDH